MKKIYSILLCLTIVSIKGFAQILPEKSWALEINTGGDINFSGLGYYTNSFNPSVGYVAKENLLVGVTSVLSSFGNNRSNESNSKMKQIGVTLAPFARKYYPINDRLYFSAELQAGLGLSAIEQENRFMTDNGISDGLQKNTHLTIFARVKPGVSYFITPRIAATASYAAVDLGHTRTKSDNTTSGIPSGNSDYFNRNTFFNLSASLSNLQGGFSFFINR